MRSHPLYCEENMVIGLLTDGRRIITNPSISIIDGWEWVVKAIVQI